VVVLMSASSGSFSLPPAPTVTGLSPASGPTTGGTSVTITGTNLAGASAVAFGSAPATSFTVTSATSITATSPVGAAGTVDVTVTTLGGTSTLASTDHFTYAVSGVTVTAVGTLVDKSGNGTATLTVTPQHVGDLEVLAVKVGSTTVKVSSVLGGGVGTWARSVGPYTGYAGTDLEIWTGAVTATGSATVIVSFSASVTSIHTALADQEFTASSGSSTTWSLDSGAGISNASSTTVTLPKLTPTGTGELYFGYGVVANTGSAGTTSGFTYGVTSDADVVVSDTSVSAAVQPTAKQSPAGISGGVVVLMSAS
jgi:hypothetical protein